MGILGVMRVEWRLRLFYVLHMRYLFSKRMYGSDNDLDENKKEVMKACNGFSWTCFLNAIVVKEIQ